MRPCWGQEGWRWKWRLVRREINFHAGFLGQVKQDSLLRTTPNRHKSFLLSPLPGLPDEKGRVQILNIHTAMMRQHNLLSSDVDIKELAVETKNYSGAELEGLVRAAQSTAMNRHIKVSECQTRPALIWDTEQLQAHK